MGKIAEQKLAMTNSFRVFGGSFFAHTLSDIYVLWSKFAHCSAVFQT